MKYLVILAISATTLLVACQQASSGGGKSKATSEHVINLDDASFAAKTESGIVLVDFWAPWCGPCRMQGPIVDEVADSAHSYATIAKVDVDEAPKVAEKFGIRSIPTIVIMKDGEILNQYVGVTDKKTLLASLDKAQQ